MKLSSLYIFCYLWLLLFWQCTPPQQRYDGPTTIPVENERICLAPLVIRAELESIDGWPNDPIRQKIILRQLTGIWNKLLAEFHRCEKLGLYQMVDDHEDPTVRISITLISNEFKSDTLYIPVRLQAESLHDGRRYIYTLQAKAWSKNKKSNSYHYIGRLLSQYRKNFPYRSLVSFFYPHPENQIPFY